MTKKITLLIISGFFIFYVAPSPLLSQGRIIDHTATDVNKVPQFWTNKAKSLFRISYGHTSHGSQIVTGMSVLYAHYSIFAYNEGGAGGALSFHDYEPSGDLGNPDRTTWYYRTRDLLEEPGCDRNVIMWSWCGQADTTEENIDLYLSLMNQLETDFPDVRFIYMTGHLNGSGEEGNLYQRNSQIRNYCIKNNKILFDFADIESYDPDGSYFRDKRANDNCDYDSDGNGSLDSNWAQEWLTANAGSELAVLSGDCGSCSHSQRLNCVLKGRAFWWMMAEMAGWEGNGQRLSYTKNSSKNPVLTRFSNYVYNAWKEGNLAYFRRNDKFGIRGYWQPSQQIISSGELDTGARPIDIASKGNYVYIIISRRPSPSEDNEIYFRRSSDYGNNWQPWHRLTYNSGNSSAPVIACEGSSVYIVWQDNSPGNNEIFFKKSPDNGNNFLPLQRITYTSGSSQAPALTARGGYIQIVWQDNSAGNYEIYHKYNSSWGAKGAWSNAKRISYSSGISNSPRLACDSTGQAIYLVWSDNSSGNFEIYFKRNTDFGHSSSWSSASLICSSTGVSQFPDINVNNSTIDIVWSDNSAGNWEIYRKQSLNSGISFGSIKRSTNNLGSSEHPRINSYLNAVIRNDNTPGNSEIYYK